MPRNFCRNINEDSEYLYDYIWKVFKAYEKIWLRLFLSDISLSISMSYFLPPLKRRLRRTGLI